MAAAVSLLQFTGVLTYLAALDLVDVPTAWRPFGALALANLTSLLAGSAPMRRRRAGATVPRHTVLWLMRSGRWLLGVEAATAGAMFISSALVSRLAGPEDLGFAEAARVVAQPVFVVAVGLAATLGPRLIESGASGDEGAAKRIARPFSRLVVTAGLLYGTVTAVAWPGNPLARLVPPAYVVPFLVPVTVAAMTLVGMVFSRRSELVGGARERVLVSVAVVAAGLQCAATLTAPWTGAFARPLGVVVFGITLLIGFEHHRRAMYRDAVLARRVG
jgi:O-antigen/teichoic acid export membrane protein